MTQQPGPRIQVTNAPEYRDKVILNVERSLAIAQPLLAVELEDELTPLPVYRP